MKRKIYILLGNTDIDTFTGKIADAYENRLRQLGHELIRQNIGELKFDPILHKGYKEIQELEPDLLSVQHNLKWCDEFVLIYPLWWGNIPAILKGLFDRVLLPGFAFKYHENGLLWDKYLVGKSAHVISTCDSPTWYPLFLHGNADFKILKKSVFGFVGINPVTFSRIGSIRFLSESKAKQRIDNIIKKIR